MFINVTDRAGERHTLEALEGFRIMEIIRDWGLDIKAECGGACACATCHVYIADDWTPKLVEPTLEEEDKLDEAFDVAANSRLSCQILMRPEFDGIELELAPGSER